MIAVAGDEVLALVELPIAGLVSDRPVEEVAEQVRALGRAYEELGSTLEYPFMFVSLLSLGVIPALRLTNRGLVDGVEFELVPRSSSRAEPDRYAERALARGPAIVVSSNQTGPTPGANESDSSPASATAAGTRTRDACSSARSDPQSGWWRASTPP